VSVTADRESIRLSNSKVNTWRRCPNQYRYKYVEKLRPKGKAVQLYRGDWLHQLLMVHYDGEDWKARHATLTKDFMKLFEEEREEYGDLPTECARIMKSYLAHYKEADKNFRVVDSEVDELIPLPNGDTFNLIIDLILEDRNDGGLWLWDHKTVARFMPPDFMQLDAQLARYYWAAKKLGYTPMRGVMFNEVITKPPTLPKFLEPSQRLEMRKNIHCDAYSYFGEIKRRGLDPVPYKDFLRFLKGRHDEWFRRTYLPRDPAMIKQLMKELIWSADELHDAHAKAAFPRTVRKECMFDCDYRDLCIIELQGGDGSDLIKHKYEKYQRDQEPQPGWVGKGK
jgi:hypothetical protein